MKSNFLETLRGSLEEPVCLVGLGNAAQGDDGAGLALARALAGFGVPHVIEAGTEPERFVGEIAEGRFRTVLFLDAADFGGSPGAAALLSASEMKARFPQVSTHRLSLGTLARLIEGRSRARAWLLGIQPGSLRPSADLTAPVEKTLEALQRLVLEALWAPAGAGCGGGAAP